MFTTTHSVRYVGEITNAVSIGTSAYTCLRRNIEVEIAFVSPRTYSISTYTFIYLCPHNLRSTAPDTTRPTSRPAPPLAATAPPTEGGQHGM